MKGLPVFPLDIDLPYQHIGGREALTTEAAQGHEEGWNDSFPDIHKTHIVTRRTAGVP